MRRRLGPAGRGRGNRLIRTERRALRRELPGPDQREDHQQAGYLVTKRGLSRALIDAVGVESGLITSCWMTMRETTERLLVKAQQAGVIRDDVTAMDVMWLVHEVAVSSEKDPARTGFLLSVMLDGLAAGPR